MSQEGKPRPSVADLLALLLAFTAAVIAFLGAVLTYLGEEKITETPLWPLPGVVLVEWVLMGAAGFIIAFFSLRKKTTGWLRATWIITGAFIPLIILGAFSIGPMVLLSFLIMLISTVVIAIRYREKWLESFGLLMIGSIGNLVILMLIITLSNQTF